jgi:hypothetical protein
MNTVLEGGEPVPWGTSAPCAPGFVCRDQDGSVYYEIGGCYLPCDEADTSCPRGFACEGLICKREGTSGEGERCTYTATETLCAPGYACGPDSLCHVAPP